MRSGSRRTLTAACVPLLVPLLVVVLLDSPAPALAESSGAVHAQIDQAFLALRSAEVDGGNITSLVLSLNEAINLTERADVMNATNPSQSAALYSQAYSLASNILRQAPTVAAQGRTAVAAAATDFYAETTVLGALAVVAYFFTPRAFWWLWVRIYGGWRVKSA
jgi:hypothetical protein